MITRLALLVAALLSGPAAAEELTAHGRAIEIATAPVEIGPGELGRGVSLEGAWVLGSDDGSFGGISGLLVEGERLIAVTDRGHWITATIAGRGADLTLAGARIAPILDPDGAPLSRPFGMTDAEGITRAGGTLYVAFEQDHRLTRHIGGGRVAEAARPAGLARLHKNSGMEGLAAGPGGRILAIAEDRDRDAFPYWLITPGAPVLRGALPARTKHDVTAAEIGPDGRLYLAQRHYSPLEGVSLRLLRYTLSEGHTPVPASAVELAAFESVSGIDNMEGLSVTLSEDGGQTLWLVSDDNFNAVQRTLLMAFRLPG